MHHGHCGAMAKNQRNKHAVPKWQLIDMILNSSRSVPRLKQNRKIKTVKKKLAMMNPSCLHIIIVWKCPRSCSAYKLKQCQSWVFYMLMFCYLMAERDRTSIWYFLFWQFDNLTLKCHNIFHLWGKIQDKCTNADTQDIMVSISITSQVFFEYYILLT